MDLSGFWRRSSTVWLGVALVIAFQVVLNGRWWHKHQAPPAWDQANHTQISQRIYYCVTQHRPLGECLTISSYYPIATHIVAVGLFLLVGPTVVGAQALGTFFWALALVSIFWFFRTVTRQKYFSLAVTASVSLIPALVEVSRFLMTDLLLLAVTFGTMTCLVKAEGWRRPRWVVTAGILTGIGLMTKWYAALYLLVPYGWLFLSTRGVWKFGVTRSRVWKYSLGAGLAGLAIALPWYWANWRLLLQQAALYAGADDSQPTALFSQKALTWYLNLAIKYQLFPWLFGLAVVGAVVFFLTERRQRWKWYVGWYCAVGYVLFTLLGNKAIHYDFHLVVFSIFWVWTFVYSVKSKWRFLGTLLGLSILIYQVFMLITLSSGWPINRARYLVWVPVFEYIDILNIDRYPLTVASDVPWPTAQIVADVLQLVGRNESEISLLRAKNNGQLRILTLVDYAQLNSSNLQALTFAQTSPYQQAIEWVSIDGWSYQVGQPLEPVLAQVPYVLVTTNQVGYDWHREVFKRNAAQQAIFDHLSQFEVVKRYSFPLSELDSSIVTGSFLPGERLTRQKICQQQRCDEVLLLKWKGTPALPANGK